MIHVAQIVACLARVEAILASALLHGCGVEVACRGAIIEHQGRVCVVAAECSGVRSICAIAATVLLAGLLWHYSASRIVAMILVAAILAAALNAVRIAISVVCPVAHDYLGYVAFFAALCGVSCIDTMAQTRTITGRAKT